MPIGPRRTSDDVPAPSAVPDDTEIDRVAELLPTTIRGQSVVLIGILVVMLFYTLYLARDLIIPIAIALMLNLLLGPMVARLKRIGLPDPLGAAVVMLVLMGGVGGTAVALSAPAAQWIERAPQIADRLESKLRSLKKPVKDVQAATKQVENLTTMTPGPPTVRVTDQTWGEWIAWNTTMVMSQTVVVVILLYFLLASGDQFMRRLVKALGTGREKRQAVEIVRGVQRDMAAYLSTVTLINAGLGLATGLAMWVIGMPNPVLWGVVAGVLNFVPYVGALITTVVLTVAALLSFDQLSQALLAPALYQILTQIEANLVTPYMLGRRLTLNPALVFLSLVMWGWLWGVAGALLAVPFLVAFKAFADHVEALSGLSIFLGRRED